MTTALTRLSGSAFEVTLTVPWADIKKVYDQVFEELASEIEIEGFRKGKAPKSVVESKIDKSKIYGEVINRIVPESYSSALKEHGLKPVMSPKVKVQTAEEEKDWQFVVQSAEKPIVKLGDYKKPISDINAKGKIWTPGSEDLDKNADKEKGGEEKKSKQISGIIEKLLEVCQIELSDLILEAETSRLVSALVEDVRQAGLTFEQYLTSTNNTTTAVQEKFHKQAESSLKLEFILEAVADDLTIKIEPSEIDAVINKETNKDRQEALRDQSYVIASILRRDKTISRLLTL